MDFNLIGYAIYLSITAVIILRVGNICYHNGNIFVAALMPGHEDLCKRTNQILLVGYYLLNIGYCAISLIQWDTIGSVAQLVETVAFKSAIIICIISVLHYCNIFIITNYIMEISRTLTGYAIYLPIAIMLTLYVSRTLFKNSKIYMLDIFKGRDEIAIA